MTEPMLRSVFFPLAGPEASVVNGQHLHGWFLTRIRELDPALAADLHAPGRHKPFTLWAGRRVDRSPEDRSPIAVAMRITSIAPRLSAVLASSDFLQPDPIRIGFAVYNPVTTPLAEHAPWLADTTWETLWHDSMDLRAAPRRVKLVFLSPTRFASGDAGTLFPVASLVFTGLVRKWQAYGSIPLAPDLSDALLRCVREEAHHVWSVPMEFSRFVEKGFVGWCEYSVGRGSDDCARLLRLLASFAFFSGVGARSTWGMGQAVHEEV